MIGNTIRGHGYCPRTTPVDTLMGAPLSMHLDVAEAMARDDDTDEDEDSYELDEFDESYL